jgi:hypothetical protein
VLIIPWGYLDLKVFSQWDKDVLSLLEIFFVWDACHVHRQRYREIERVKSSFVSDDKGMFFHWEFGEVNGIFWRSEKVE